MIIDNTPADRAADEFEAALERLPAVEAEADRLKFLAMLVESPGDLFFAQMELNPAGPTHDIERSTLQPTEFYLGWIATLRARDFDRQIKQAS